MLLGGAWCCLGVLGRTRSLASLARIARGCCCVLLGAAWWCLVLLGGAWCCLVVLGGAWCCLVLLGAAWCCLVKLARTSMHPVISGSFWCSWALLGSSCPCFVLLCSSGFLLARHGVPGLIFSFKMVPFWEPKTIQNGSLNRFRSDFQRACNQERPRGPLFSAYVPVYVEFGVPKWTPKIKKNVVQKWSQNWTHVYVGFYWKTGL